MSGFRTRRFRTGLKRSGFHSTKYLPFFLFVYMSPLMFVRKKRKTLSPIHLSPFFLLRFFWRFMLFNCITWQYYCGNHCIFIPLLTASIVLRSSLFLKTNTFTACYCVWLVQTWGTGYASPRTTTLEMHAGAIPRYYLLVCCEYSLQNIGYCL